MIASKQLKLLIILFSFTVCAQENDGLYSIVTIPKGKQLIGYEKPTIFPKIVGRIPFDAESIKTTWETKEFKGQYWIELNYQGLELWVKREAVTQTNPDLSRISKDFINDSLLIVATAIQKGEIEGLKTILYPIRGLHFYTYKTRTHTYVTFPKLESSWRFITDKRYTAGTIMNYQLSYINQFLKNSFVIEEEQAKNIESILPRLSNFKFYRAYNEKETLFIAFENWYNKTTISALVLEKND